MERLPRLPEVIAVRVTGHKTRGVFDRYNMVSPNDFRHAVRRLNERGTALETVIRLRTIARINLDEMGDSCTFELAQCSIARELLRRQLSPVPAQTMFGSEGATVNDPIEETG
jgi:hypothetical protein